MEYFLIKKYLKDRKLVKSFFLESKPRGRFILVLFLGLVYLVRDFDLINLDISVWLKMLLVFILSVFFGYLVYMCGGGLVYIRSYLCQIDIDYIEASNIYLYTNIVAIPITIIYNILINLDNLNIIALDPIINVILYFLLFCSWLLSVHIQYRVVIFISNKNTLKLKLLFFWLPATVYFIAYFKDIFYY